MNRLINVVLLGIALSYSSVALGQTNSRVDMVKDASVEMRTTRPDGGGFGDLMPLIDIIGDVRVVLLGEQTHGDGSIFEARTRLVEFLHQEMGFDVLAIESGMLETARAQAALRAGGSVRDAVAGEIYAIWSGSEQAQPLFEYVQRTFRTDRPLELVGFDPQFSSDSSGSRLLSALSHTLHRAGVPHLEANDSAQLHHLASTLQTYGAEKISQDEHRDYTALLARLQTHFDSPTPYTRSRFSRQQLRRWSQVIANLSAMEKVLYLRSQGPPFTVENIKEVVRAPEYVMARNVRDQQMAKNILWLLDTMKPDGKMVIWAANIHVAYLSQQTATAPLSEGEAIPEYRPMGQHLREAVGDDLYTILSVAYEGNWEAVGATPQRGVYDPARPGTLAYLLHDTGLDAAVLDLEVLYQNDSWSAAPVTVRSNWTVGQMDDLRAVCNALLFIDRMYPSTPIEDIDP